MKTRSRRDSIIDAAVKLIHTQGYQNTSVEDIIEASGVWRGSFYYHFSTKEELGFAVLEHQFQLFSKLIEQQLAKGGNPIEKIEHLLDALENWHRENGIKEGCPFGNLVCELSATHDAFRLRLGRLFHDFQSQFADTLSPWRFKMVPGVTPESLAEFLMVTIEGSSLLGKVDQDVEVIARTHEHAKRYLRSCFTNS